MLILRYFSIFILLFSSYAFCDEALKARVRQLEIQVRELTEEVIRLRTALQTQEKFSEKLTKEKKQEALFDELIESYKQQEKDNLYNFYRKIIHSHIWLGGYVELKVESRESRKDLDLFDLSHCALSFRSSLNEFISIQGEINFSKEDEIFISHAYGIFSFDSIMSLKAGVIRVPFGKYNSIYSPPSQKLGSLPQLNEYIIPSIWSDPGISIFGKYEFAFPLTLSYEILVSSGFRETAFHREIGNQDARREFHRDNNEDLQWSARLEFVPRINVDTFALYFGVSGLIGQYDERKNNEYRGIAFDWFFQFGPFSLIGDHDSIRFIGEYAKMTAEADFKQMQLFPNTTTQMMGYYFQLDYCFFPESWRDFDIFNSESKFAIVFRYEYIDLEHTKTGGSIGDDREIYTLGFNFRPIRQSVFRLEYSWILEKFPKNNMNNRFLASFASFF